MRPLLWAADRCRQPRVDPPRCPFQQRGANVQKQQREVLVAQAAFHEVHHLVNKPQVGEIARSSKGYRDDVVERCVDPWVKRKPCDLASAFLLLPECDEGVYRGPCAVKVQLVSSAVSTRSRLLPICNDAHPMPKAQMCLADHRAGAFHPPGAAPGLRPSFAPHVLFAAQSSAVVPVLSGPCGSLPSLPGDSFFSLSCLCAYSFFVGQASAQNAPPRRTVPRGVHTGKETVG